MNAQAETATNDQESKDRFFERLGALADEMAAAHGKDFAMGALVLAARWLAENKSRAMNQEQRPQ